MAQQYSRDQLEQIARSYALQYGIDPDYFARLIAQESRWNPSAVSPVGAQGLTQIMPDTARDPGFGVAPVRNINDPREQLRFGAEYLAAMEDRYDADPELMAVAYNAGPGVADRVARGAPVPSNETRNYIPAVAAGLPYRDPDQGGQAGLEGSRRAPGADTAIGDVTDYEFMSQFDREHVSPAAQQALARLERRYGSGFMVNSAHRDPAHNRRVGGARQSQHMEGNAFDFDVSDMSREERLELIRAAREEGFGGVGVYNNALHFDVGPTRAWGPDYSSNTIPDWAAEAINHERRDRFPDAGLTFGDDVPDWDEAWGEHYGDTDRHLSRGMTDAERQQLLTNTLKEFSQQALGEEDRENPHAYLHRHGGLLI